MSDSKNSYTSVIDLLMNEKVDWKKVAVYLAKTNPDALIEAVALSNDIHALAMPDGTVISASDFNKARAIYKETGTAVGGKVAAIRFLREQYGTGLVDTKTYIEDNMGY